MYAPTVCSITDGSAPRSEPVLGLGEQENLQKMALQPLCDALDAMRFSTRGVGGIAGFMGGLAAIRAARTTDAVRLALLFIRDALATLHVLRNSLVPSDPECALRLRCAITQVPQ